MLRRLVLVTVTGFGIIACGGSRLLLGHPVTAPLSVLLRLAPDVADGDDGGGVAALADAMLDALRERGIVATVYAAPDEHPPPPRIEVWVSGFDPGSSGARRIGQLGAPASALAGAPLLGVTSAIVNLAGTGSLYVHCRVYEVGNEHPSYDHVYQSLIRGDEDAATKAGRSLGEEIINDVFTDHPV